MAKLTQFIAKTLSVRLSLMVVAALASLLTVALFIMFHYSRKAVKEEALQKASQTLESTVQNIDNILFSVEQASGNIYFLMLKDLDKPDKMFEYSRRLVESNPYIDGCAIAFEPYHFKDRGKYFMAYVHHEESGDLAASNSPIIMSETFGSTPYNEQRWYVQPMEKGVPCWINPLKDEETEDDALITFCLPIYDKDGKKIGIMGVDVSVSLLSNIVLGAKPSPNSYCTLLGSDGSFIVHPDTTKLLHKNAITKDSDPMVREAAQAMISGERGYKFFRLHGIDSYVFYEPFERADMPGRSLENMGWSVGIIYPEDDIFGDYNKLFTIMLVIAVIGLILLMAFSQLIIHRQLLPLQMLTETAQRIAGGHYSENSELTNEVQRIKGRDEVGQLQKHFHKMQMALSSNMQELNKLTSDLNKQGEVLEAANEQAKEADRMKTAVLHNMTNKMIAPVEAISTDVTTLLERYGNMQQQEARQLVDNIQQQGNTVTELLNDLLEESGKS